MTSSTVRARLVQAAFELFEEQGYDATTADQIAARAGAGRTTFFRAFGSKDDVALVDHEQILAAVQDKLDSATDGSWQKVAREAARVVLDSHVDEGAQAKQRYRVMAGVPALRDRELIIMARYQRVFYEHFRRDPEVPDALTAELLAAAWVTTHNHVLRRWLVGVGKDPDAQLEAGLISAYDRIVHGITGQEETAVLVFRTSASLESVLPAVQEALAPKKAKPRGRRKLA